MNKNNTQIYKKYNSYQEKVILPFTVEVEILDRLRLDKMLAPVLRFFNANESPYHMYMSLRNQNLLATKQENN